MIFQQPQTSLNPVFMAGDQVAEVLTIHEKLKKSGAWEKPLKCSAWSAYQTRNGG